MAIPRILHQTWKTDQVPPEWAGYAQSWRALHPAWEYRLWTDDANRAFVAGHYPELLETFDSYRYGIQRADAIRYCLLHLYGGVYVDLDMECLQPLDGLIEGHSFVAALEPEVQGRHLGKSALVSNAFMASEPGHPFLDAVIRRLIANPSPGLTHRDVLATTGPLMLEAVRGDYRGNDVTVLPSQVTFPFVALTPELRALQSNAPGSAAIKAKLAQEGTYAVHYWANSWVGTLAGELVNPDPHNIEGYDFYAGLDSPGNDVANVGRDIREAAIACRRIEGAVAFNTDGFVKDRLLPRRAWLPIGGGAKNEGLYVKRRGRTSRLLGRLLSLGRRRP